MMTSLPRFTMVSAGLTVLLTLAAATALHAQAPSSGPPLSSGSGAGTGTGVMGGDSRNTTGTGQESGRIGGTTGTGTSSGTGPGSFPSNEPMIPGVGRNQNLPSSRIPNVAPEDTVPRGPGAVTNFPDNPSLLPSPTVPGLEDEAGRENINAVRLSELKNAQLIDQPGDRSLALQRTANAAIFSNQLEIARQALADAARAAIQEPTPLVRDQRMIAIITSFSNLADADLREGKVDLSLPEFNFNTGPEALPTNRVERLNLIDRAREAWRRAADLAWRITNVTYRVEMLYRVADNLAYGSQTIVNEFPHDGESRSDGQSAAESRAIEARADEILRYAASIAVRIERPVWRDRALVTIAQAAAASKQFARGLDIAHMIPQPEVRSDALVRLAEAQARRGNGQDATATYAEAARAVASIPLDDPRAILAGVLIDNLISVGRFEDARSTIVLYPDRPRQLIALGAIAESQGRRGRADAARAWIAREIPPQEQAILYRRVNAGIIAAIEQNRSRDLSNRER